MKLNIKVVVTCIFFILTTSCFLFNKTKVAKNELHIAWESLPRSIDARFATDANSQYLSDLINCSLIRFDEKGQVGPYLAESWNWISPLKLSLKIRSGIRFSDSTQVSPADVVANYTYAVSGADSLFKQTFKSVSKITSKEDQVIFDFKEPDAAFLTNLTLGILPSKTVAKPALKDSANLVGCGAFTLDSINSSKLVLKPNKSYDLGPTPKISKIHFDIVKDETTRFAKLRKGEIDLIQKSISRDKVKKVRESYPNLKVQQAEGINTTYLAFNMKDETVGNPKVRQALAYAFDREAIIKYVLADLATPANSMLPKSNPFHLASLPEADLNMNKATSLLKEALGDDLSKVSFKISTTTDLTRVTIAKALASQLEKLGLKATVQSLEWGKFKEDVDKGSLQMWLLSWVGFKDPDILRYTFATESFPPNGGNRGFFSNKSLDKLLLQAKAEVDSTKRKDLYDQAQQIVNDQMPYVFLWHEDNFAIHSNRVKDFTLYADGRYSALKKAYVTQ